MPTLAAFLNLVVAIALFILAAYGLRALWVRAVPARVLAYLIAPGVAVHELSHALACLLMGAKVHSMVLFRADGSGEVRHGPPKVKYIGDMVIALSPLAGGTACLLLLGWLLRAPINFYTVRTNAVQPDQMRFLLDLLGLVWDDLGLFVQASSWTDWRTYVFLYFAMCFTLTMAPSRQDLKNGAAGILILCGIALIGHLIVDRLIQARGDGPVFRFIANLLISLHYPFAIVAVTALLGGLIYAAGAPFRGRRRRRS
ncbi:MAG: M50 family metallopeptidase [Planctomycetes bacterium]|nr:M50 family metallopeptidase [Planctomycetota bacterium]